MISRDLVLNEVPSELAHYLELTSVSQLVNRQYLEARKVHGSCQNVSRSEYHVDLF